VSVVRRKRVPTPSPASECVASLPKGGRSNTPLRVRGRGTTSDDWKKSRTYSVDDRKESLTLCILQTGKQAWHSVYSGRLERNPGTLFTLWTTGKKARHCVYSVVSTTVCAYLNLSCVVGVPAPGHRKAQVEMASIAPPHPHSSLRIFTLGRDPKK
jgi:hypothetical protein